MDVPASTVASLLHKLCEGLAFEPGELLFLNKVSVNLLHYWNEFPIFLMKTIQDFLKDFVLNFIGGGGVISMFPN